MKITLQSLRAEKIPVEVNEDCTVADLKQKAEEATGNSVATLNLVFSGKPLVDTKTLSEYGIKDGNTVIFFVKKAKNVAAAPKPESSTPAQPSEPSSNWGQEPKPADAPVPKQPAAPATPTVDAPKPAAPEVDTAKIETLVSMGYDRSKAEPALRAAFGDVSRAVEFIENGIPDDMATLAGLSGTGAPAATPSQPAGQTTDPSVFSQMSDDELRAYARQQAGGTQTGTSAQDPMLTSFLNALRQLPNLAQIRALLAQNPAAEDVILSQLVGSQPGIAPLVTTYRKEIHAVLAGTESSASTRRLLPPDLFNGRLPEIAAQLGVTLTTSTSSPAAPISSIAGPGGAPTGVTRIAITQEDKANIDQIVAVTGCSEQAALQAYIACDKNVSQAINFVLDS